MIRRIVILVIFILSMSGYGVRRIEDCDNPKAPHCAKEAGGNHKACGKCEMDCNGEGRKPDDRRCSTFCCDDKCDCSPPCS